jgi:uncharacterized protein with PIN domain
VKSKKTPVKKKDHSPILRKSHFRFYEELNDHLPESWQKKFFVYEFTGKPSLKNTIHALGVPHGEVDLIVVDGQPVDFNYHLQGGEKVSVYPVFESFDISSINRLRPEPLRETKFIVDVNLGKLALKLRLLGFDTIFRNNLQDEEIVTIAQKEHRIILTRDKGILKQNAVSHGYFLRNDDPKKQLFEVVKRLQLQNQFKAFTRCSNCNGVLGTVDKNKLKGRLPEDTLTYYDVFWKCKNCQKIYWQGSHFNKILNWIEELKNTK